MIPRIMGILNVTPDSFSDGGNFYHLESALNQARAMIQAGATIIDIGGESTRPGAESVDLQTEMARVMPVLTALRAEFPKNIQSNIQNNIEISIDTTKPEIMRAACLAGADWINDVFALQTAGALDVLRDFPEVKICLMHCQGQPRDMQHAPHYDDVVGEVLAFLEKRAEICVNFGITQERMVIDIGIGFGKTLEHNLLLLKNLEKFTQKFPVLLGVSRKSLIAKITGASVENRLPGSLALAVLAMQAGVQIIRVHDVAETKQALDVAGAVLY